MRFLFPIIPFALLAACVHDDMTPGAGPLFPLVNGAGASTGSVQAEPRAGGTYLRIWAEGLSPGEHGVHLHAVGRCDGPAFQSAGAHWNPSGKQHGHLNPAGAHAGDFPNLIVSANGRGTLAFLVGGPSIADADGTALVIHAQRDDYRTDPSGNSGDRVACAVIAAP